MTHAEPGDDHAYEAYLRAGAAVYNAGFHHAAHDAWERRWLRETGAEADLLQGLIQLAAAVHHADAGNEEGAAGLAGSAQAYLGNALKAGVDHDVNVSAVRAYLTRVEADPSVVDRDPPVRLEIDGSVPQLDTLVFPAAGLAAEALAEDTDHESVIESGVAFATIDLDDNAATSPFVALVLDYCRAQADGDPDVGVVLARLKSHVNRRERRDDDVAGLFEDGEE